MAIRISVTALGTGTAGTAGMAAIAAGITAGRAISSMAISLCLKLL
jgi:hypothetical protein